VIDETIHDWFERMQFLKDLENSTKQMKQKAFMDLLKQLKEYGFIPLYKSDNKENVQSLYEFEYFSLDE
jgi:hypothetical protein